MKTTIETPWGPSQHSREIAPGITEHSTASHGGLQLSRDRWDWLMAHIPFCPKYAPASWLEEDCDYYVAVLAFPSCFNTAQVRAAVQMFSGQGDYQGGVRLWLQTSDVGMKLKVQVREWERTNAHLWEFAGCNSNKRGWNIHLCRIGDRERQDVQMLEYPDQPFYSDADIERLRLADEAPAPIRAASSPRFREEDCGGVFDGSRVWSDTELGGAPGF